MSTPPLSSSSSSTSSPSPLLRDSDDMSKAELSEQVQFDDPEAFELLLQTITQHSESQATDSAEDWARMSTWDQPEPKPNDFGNDFNFSFPMDLDTDPLGLSVDPSSLHFNTSIFSQTALAENPYYGIPLTQGQDLTSASLFPFDSSWATGAHLEPGTGRRLSVTSSSSSSGASLSPIIETKPVISSSPPSESGFADSDPASELAQRVRLAAGVTLAVPVSTQVKQLAAASSQGKPTSHDYHALLFTKAPATPQFIMASPPISEPSLRASPSAASVSDSGSSSSSPSSAAQSPAPETAASAPTARPKTSHTTIERRYRTNLNARITGLRQAVPALRVLELKDGAPSPYNDIVDSRGFVDGVKVARKMSKANILGKATEYIRVLKKREARMKREQDGLKSLVSGLVGGPALLKEWEREWREKFGGEENDEVEGDAASDDEDGDGEDSEGDDDEGRPRKKAKAVKAPKKVKPVRPAPPPPVPTVPGAVPEKRKRGRPRKVPLPPAIPATTLTPMEGVTATLVHPPTVPLQHDIVSPASSQPAPQYLLAVFAFFSVFNSPLTSGFGRSDTHAHAPNHSHHGTVLTAHPSMVPTTSSSPSRSGYGFNEAVQAFHLLVSTLVFFYIVFPWLSGVLRQNSRMSKIMSSIRAYTAGYHKAAPVPPSPTVAYFQHEKRATLHDALCPTVRGAPDEAAGLRSALGVSTGVFGLMQSVIKAARIDRGLEMNQLEQRAWVRLGELVAFDGAMPKTTRLQTYWCMSWHVSTFATSTSDLTTLALMILPVSQAKATELWDRARNREVLRPHEKIVLTNMSVNDAAKLLAKWRLWHDTERRGGRCAACEKRTPLGVLAAILIRERLRRHAAAMFVRSVVPSVAREEMQSFDTDDLVATYNSEKDYQDDQQRRETIEAGRSIGGRTAELATLLERIWDTGFIAHDEVLPQSAREGEAQEWEDTHDLARHDESEIRNLLSATLVYRRIFPSSLPSCAAAVSVILSPPPSPSRKNLALHLSLRAALASSAFDFEGKSADDQRLAAALEDARDHVNDMLIDLERSMRRNVKAL